MAPRSLPQALICGETMLRQLVLGTVLSTHSVWNLEQHHFLLKKRNYHLLNGDHIHYQASLVAQTVKNRPAMQEIQVRSLGWKILLRKERQPTPVFLSGEFHGERRLVGYSPWGCTESDMTEHA